MLNDLILYAVTQGEGWFCKPRLCTESQKTWVQLLAVPQHSFGTLGESLHCSSPQLTICERMIIILSFPCNLIKFECKSSQAQIVSYSIYIAPSEWDLSGVSVPQREWLHFLFFFILYKSWCNFLCSLWMLLITMWMELNVSYELLNQWVHFCALH